MKKALLSMILLLFVVSTVTALDGYDLLKNITFSGFYGATNSTNWATSTTNCKSSPCLYNSNNALNEWWYIANSTFLVNVSKYKAVVQGWIKDAETSENGYGGWGLVSGATYTAQSVSVWSSATEESIRMRTNAGETVQYFENHVGITDLTWYWMQVNITNQSMTAYFYDDASMSDLHFFGSANVSTLTNGYLGLYKFRRNYWDDIEFYTETVGGGSPSPTLTVNTNLFNTQWNLTNFNVTYNGTFTNENTDVANCSLNLKGVYGNQTADLVNLSHLNTFLLYLPSNSTEVYNISINCSNYEVSDQTLWYNITLSTTTYNSTLAYIQALFTQINDNVIDAKGELKMLSIIVLYGLLVLISFYLYKHNENAFGSLVLFASLGVFTMLVGIIYNEYFTTMVTGGTYGDLLSYGSLTFIFVMLATKLGMISVFMFKSFRKH